MMSSVRLAAPVYLAAGIDNTVWSARTCRLPVCLGDTPDAAMATVKRAAGRVRLLGSAQNAALIGALARVGSAGIGAIELGTPDMGALVDPRTSLIRLRGANCQLAASVGGWHPLTEGELPFYESAAGLGQDDGSASTALLGHPVVRRLQFIAGGDGEALCRVLAEMRDPRWHVDPAHPDRHGRLYGYFGVGRRHDLVKGDLRVVQGRRVVAERAWLADSTVLSRAAEPGGWLLRLYATASGSERGARWLATRRFLQFVRAVWLDWLYADLALFVPEHFFAKVLGSSSPHSEIAAAYRAHVEEGRCTPQD